MNEHLIVRVTPDGAVAAETQGIKGQPCLDYIQILEDLLDAETTSSAFTDEYYQTASTQMSETRHEIRQGNPNA